MTVSTSNPYDILAVSPASSKTEIVKAVAVALKDRRHPPKAIAEAQKWLMNPEKRLLADYLLPVLPPVSRVRRPDLPAVPSEAPVLTIDPAHTGLTAELAAMRARLAEEAQLGV